MNAEDGQNAVGSWTGGDDDVRRTFTLGQRRALYWRLTTGGESHLEAAEVAGVTDRQVRRWLERPDFKAAWNEPESWARTEVRKQRAGLEYKALLRAHLLLDSDATPPSVAADVIGKALTDARQTRAGEATQGQLQAVRLILAEWRVAGEQILKEGETGSGE